MKEACLVLVDVGVSVSSPTVHDVKQALSAFTMKTFIQGGQNEYGLVLFGADATCNRLNESTGEYEHINVVAPLARPDFSFIKQIQSIATASGQQQGDTIDAIVVGVNEVVNRVKKLKFTKRMYVFTSVGGPSCDPEQIADLATIIKDNQVVLNIIVLDGDSDDRKTNLKSLNLLAEESGSSLLSAEIGLRLMSQPGSKSVRPTAKFRGCLEITSFIRLASNSFGKIMAAGMPSLKKQSAMAPGSEVKLSRASINKATGQEVSPDMRLKAFRFGNTLVPISDIDETLFACRDNKTLKVLGFLPRAQLPRYLYMSGVDCIVPSADDPQIATAFSAFVAAMNELNFVAIARYCKKDGAPPRPALLSPGLEGEADVMYLNYLPFADDIRECRFESLSRFIVTDQMAKSIDSLIDALDLSTADVDLVTGDRIPSLAPKSLYNPLLQRFYQTLHARLVNENADVAEIPSESRAALEPNPELFLKAESTFRIFKDTFPLVKVTEPVKGRGRDWRSEIAVAVPEGVPEMGADVSLSLSNLTQRQVTQVSTANPVEDYRVLVQNRDRVPDCTRQLFDIVIKLVKESFQGSGDPKSLDCVSIARYVCKNLGLAPIFNEGMERVRESIKDTTFWNMLGIKNVLPISCEESASSALSIGQAQSFYEETVTESEHQQETGASIWEGDGWDDF